MIKTAIDSFIAIDSELAQKVLSTDDKLDDLVREDIQMLIHIMKEKTENIEKGLTLYSLFHELERLGDHATNIAEEVYFITNAESIRHKDTDTSDD